jgi:hypothetical protein
MDVDEGGNDKANDADNPSESRDRSGKSTVTNSQASGSGQNIIMSSGARNGSGPSQDQSEDTVLELVTDDNKVHPAYTLVNSGLNFSQNTCGSCKFAPKEKAEFILHAGQQGLQNPSMFKEAQPCTQHATAPQRYEGKKGAVDAYLPGDLVQNGNTKQVANLLPDMNDNIPQNVNTLCNEPLLFTDLSTEQVEHTNMVMNSSVNPMHGTVSHGKISGAKNLCSLVIHQ